MNKLLPYIERVFLATLAVAFILQFTGPELPILMTISLTGIGMAFFLNAYKPLDIEPPEGEKMGFNELLGLTIIPKVLWISTAVVTIGIMLYTLNQENDGYVSMLYIGGSTIIIASVVMLILKVIGAKYLNSTFPLYYRALPALFVAAYILFG